MLLQLVKQEAMNLKSIEGYMGQFGGKEGEGRNVNYNLNKNIRDLIHLKKKKPKKNKYCFTSTVGKLSSGHHESPVGLTCPPEAHSVLHSLSRTGALQHAA